MIYSEPFGDAYPYYHNTDGTVNYQSYSSTAGVRPVITLPKSSLIRDYIIIIIEGTLYRAKEGMTWKEWINSEYNTTGYNLGNCSDLDECTNDPNGSYILDPTDSYKNLYQRGSYVYSTDIITSEFAHYDFDYYSVDALNLEVVNYLLNYKDELAKRLYTILVRGYYRPKVIIEYNRIAYMTKTTKTLPVFNSNEDYSQPSPERTCKYKLENSCDEFNKFI